MPRQLDDTDRAYLDALLRGDEAEADRLTAAMDAADATERARLTSPSALLSAALWYAQQGAPVFPLQVGAKIPLPGTRGFKDATTDPSQIRAWWRARPDFNIGLATGHVFDVIDFDGPDAIALGYTHPQWWPATIGKVCTPRPGGNHWYVAPTGAGNKAGMAPGVDYRGLGGYVVAPPSRTDIGAYTWLSPLTLQAAA